MNKYKYQLIQRYGTEAQEILKNLKLETKIYAIDSDGSSN